MKKIYPFLLLILLIFNGLNCFAQSTQPALYDERADAMQQIQQAVIAATVSDKYVLCQVGGNWCPWCLRFAQFVETDSIVNIIVNENFIYIHLNWSKANKNAEAMRYLGNPARFGFPVLVILDETGKPIHIQNSAYLEEGKGYHSEKVADFLKQWTPTAVRTLRD